MLGWAMGGFAGHSLHRWAPVAAPAPAEAASGAKKQHCSRGSVGWEGIGDHEFEKRNGKARWDRKTTCRYNPVQCSAQQGPAAVTLLPVPEATGWC
ncbi:uncharacterized protein ColSpa_12106 [Colletotrichum spaethianum]|uniref:Uncharacterized protein n=1 Tax=Colletotrichum spaethianum TaxID=700344 RepID=A0AA37PH52_9PEZI|nr:uncharacterized protein ColSpa_12106 [Colletotrichum spaethianum]GKT51925.1 hypothetical protein ColSpa_12106 [Colletotrichum spaethianum]